MAQVTTGIRKILEYPIVYTTFQNLLGSESSQDKLVAEYIKPEDGMYILDVGCGPGSLLEHIYKDVVYYGFDFEESYIQKAQEKYGTRGKFFCEDVTNFEFKGNEKFDRILILSVLHHLEDEQVHKILSVLTKLLKPDGYLLVQENTFVKGQSLIAKAIIKMDRGQNVRKPEGYLNLCQAHFKNCTYEIRHDLLRIPYTHILIKCSN
jgi:2-polyprenyl-3-methyl-5-hydroxy-6-metoxy-1,4-benzoquinol methylase